MSLKKMKIFAKKVSVLAYATSTWTMTKTEKKEMDALKMGTIRVLMCIRWGVGVRRVE